jgi:arginine-tRNA-protein transferase
MATAFHYLAPAGTCGYLPHETWQLEYEVVAELSSAQYATRLLEGWRRFGRALFRHRCPSCTACLSLRVLATEFRPNRSQRRVRTLNENAIRLQIGPPTVSSAKLDLYDRYHARQALTKGWPDHGPKDLDGYIHSFVDNPIPTQEWSYYLGDRLVGVGYVDDVPGAMSAIYFFHDPGERRRAMGTWNILCLIERAAERRVPLYLGFHVSGCRSMEYKARFVPNQVRGPDGRWRPFQD